MAWVRSALALCLVTAASPLIAADRAAEIAILRQAKLEAWPRFYRENDADGLADFLADGFVQFGDDGARETKAEAVEWVRRNKWANAQRDFRYEIGDIVFYSDDVANIFGVGSFDRGGGTCRMRYTSANIFVRQAGKWRPKFSHTTKPECAPAAAAKDAS